MVSNKGVPGQAPTTLADQTCLHHSEPLTVW